MRCCHSWIAVVWTEAAADLARANVPPTLVLPLTLTVPKKPELPVMVAVPPMTTLFSNDTAAATLRVPKNPELPVIVAVPPTTTAPSSDTLQYSPEKLLLLL
jgi:hypothetical protein